MSVPDDVGVVHSGMALPCEARGQPAAGFACFGLCLEAFRRGGVSANRSSISDAAEPVGLGISLLAANLSEIPDLALSRPKVVTPVITAAYERHEHVGSEFVEHQNGVANGAVIKHAQMRPKPG